MEDLQEIYDRIKFLRGKGVKMKEIAEQIGFTPSVVSALYTTVLPAYFRNLAAGMDEDDAIGNALSWVNNLSKKKLLGSMARVKAALYAIDASPRTVDGDSGIPFLDNIERLMRATAGQVGNLCGAYMSYSVSSNSCAMKIEPYLVTLAGDGSHVEVVHNSAYGATHRGFALMNGASHLYLMFNESRQPQLSLFNICLKIPMFDRPPFLRGLYTCFDYNFNPIARRILMVKLSDDMQRDEFMTLRAASSSRTRWRAASVPTTTTPAGATTCCAWATSPLPRCLRTTSRLKSRCCRAAGTSDAAGRGGGKIPYGLTRNRFSSGENRQVAYPKVKTKLLN